MGKLIDLTGRTIDNYVVLEQLEAAENGSIQWKCRCICGNEVVRDASHLLRSSIKHPRNCGCIKQKRGPRSKEHTDSIVKAITGKARNETGKVLTRSEINKRYVKLHPEEYTADARRDRRKASDTNYRKTPEYAKAIEKYAKSGKKGAADRDGHLRREYGKTFEDKVDQYNAQKGLCGVCNKPLPKEISKCHWDHNHSTGKMRELLHTYCNLLVGSVEHELHESALEYLRRHSE